MSADKNALILQYLGVDIWHNKGYTGKNGLSGTCEDFTAATVYQHANITAQIFHLIAPERQLLYVPIDGVENSSFVASIGANSFDCIFASLSMALSANVDTALGKTPYTTMVLAAGNDSENAYSKGSALNNVWGVGALRFLWSSMVNGQPAADATLTLAPADYTSVSDYVDFCAPTDLIDNNEDSFGGTSCSAPVLCGMIALVNDFFIQKTGQPLTRAMMYKFLQDNTRDVYLTGKDDKTGLGLPILPDPDKIDVTRYIEVDEKTEKLVASASPWAQKSWRKAILLGATDGNNPKGNLTREQIMVMLDTLGVLK